MSHDPADFGIAAIVPPPSSAMRASMRTGLTEALLAGPGGRVVAGGTCRRSTASSCRRTRISTSLSASLRLSSTASPSSRRTSRYTTDKITNEMLAYAEAQVNGTFSVFEHHTRPPGMVVPDRRADLARGEVEQPPAICRLDERTGGRRSDIGGERTGVADEQLRPRIHTGLPNHELHGMPPPWPAGARDIAGDGPLG
jgi:hypothetical protein